MTSAVCLATQQHRYVTFFHAICWQLKMCKSRHSPALRRGSRTLTFGVWSINYAHIRSSKLKSILLSMHERQLQIKLYREIDVLAAYIQQRGGGRLFSHCSARQTGLDSPVLLPCWTQRSHRPALFLPTSFSKNIAPPLAVTASGLMGHRTHCWVSKHHTHD